ncbi:hypothetical protein ACIRR9_53565, partial [Streptomyces sp. NPDC101234]
MKSRIRIALRFLTRLDEQDKSLDALCQEVIDCRLISDPRQRYTVRCFLDWAVRRRIVGSIAVPAPRDGHPVQFIDDDRCPQLLRRCLNDVDLPVDVRVAGALVLLFGVTVQRVLQLQPEDLNRGNDRVDLRLGDKLLVLPPRLARLVLELAESPRDRSAVGRAIAATQFLFPGRVPGRPAHAAAFANKLNRHGIKITAVRNTARIALALVLPAAVLAGLFDMHINTAVRRVHRAKRDWSSYIAARAEDLNPTSARRPVPAHRTIVRWLMRSVASPFALSFLIPRRGVQTWGVRALVDGKDILADAFAAGPGVDPQYLLVPDGPP